MAAEESYPELLFICIFWLLHAIFSLTEYIMAFCYLLSSKWRSVITQETYPDMEMVKNISKLPKHVAFLVLENDIVYDDVAKLVIWSLLVGINAISLYDVHGKLKRNQGYLLNAINKEYVKVVDNIDPFKLVWRPHDNSELDSDENQTVIINKNGIMFPDKNGNGESKWELNGVNHGVKNGSNGVKNGENGGYNGHNGHSENGQLRTVSISLLSKEDGKQDIVKTTKRLIREVKKGDIALEDINIPVVGDNLNTNKFLPDPCVLVRCGTVASNADFPPWHLRLTEMYSMVSHKKVTPNMFMEVLKKYGRCEQRLGK